jgi:hypothetical protein
MLATLADYTLVPFANLFATSPQEAGERGLYILTSPRYVAESSRGETGSGSEEEHAKCQHGVFRLGATDESCKESEVLKRYTGEGAQEKVWSETRKVWDRCVGSR